MGETKQQRTNRIRRWKYGLTLAQFEEMLAKQGHRCAACRGPFKRTPAVDHNHQTGRVRALLCHGCNLGVGFVEHRLHGAWLDYVDRFRER